MSSQAVNKQLKYKNKETTTNFLKNFASLMIQKDNIQEISDSTGLATVTLDQMRRYGKGSVHTWILVIMHCFNLTEKDLHFFLHNLDSLLQDQKKVRRTSDLLITQIRRFVSENEFVGWLRLLYAKIEIDIDLGLRKEKESKKYMQIKTREPED